MTDNLGRSLSLPGPHPWALARLKRTMAGVRTGVYVAFMRLTRADGGPVGRQSAYPADALCHRIVLGRVVRPLTETATPFFEGFPFEFWFDLEEDLELSSPVNLTEVSVLLNERLSGLGLEENKLREVLSNGRSSSMGMYFDGEPRLTDYFTEGPGAVLPAVTSTASLVPRSVSASASGGALRAAADEFAEAVVASGLVFSGINEDLPRAFLAALMAKRFVLLTGLSGSGKTQIARALGQWLGADVAGPRHILIPVRPDWTTPEPLLGFEDALLPPHGGSRAWMAPAALQFMLRANADPYTPYLLVLDEMNLAHVERYFADVLSGLESGEPILPNLERRPNGYWYPKDAEPSLVPLPANLLIVGTVNVDETTYQFSPKVLDRSISFEFRVTTEELSRSLRALGAVAPGSPESLNSLLGVVSDADWHVDRSSVLSVDLGNYLAEVHERLSTIGLEFGHRSYREALRLAAILPECGVPEESVTDMVVMSKILPRVHGSRRQLEPFLRWLEAEAVGTDQAKPLMPLVARKTKRMLASLLVNQYAGFAE
jgi:hypothetical protein